MATKLRVLRGETLERLTSRCRFNLEARVARGKLSQGSGNGDSNWHGQLPFRECPTNFSLYFAIVIRFFPLKRLLSAPRDKLKFVGQQLLLLRNVIDPLASPRNEDPPRDPF